MVLSQSVLMNKGDKMYTKKSFISNPVEHKRELQKIVTRSLSAPCTRLQLIQLAA